MSSRLSLTHASKTFGTVAVLRDVHLDVRAGEIHGLVGQNGSGKSVLIRLLSGYHNADPGAELQVDGTPVPFPLTPGDLRRHGISFVHQSLGLDDSISVIENVRIGRFRVNRVTRRIRWRDEADLVSATLATLGADTVDPYALVGSLNHGQRASVAIARAIQGTRPGSGLIVFDESTQSLPRDVLSGFYEQVRRLAASGTAVLIVSHRLDEVLALCDRVTVLEDGRVTIAGQPTQGISQAELGRLILGNSASGRELASGEITSARSTPGEVRLRVDELSGYGVEGASFSVRSGELVGIIGDDDSGYDQLPALLTGVRRATAGSLEIRGQTSPAVRMHPRRAAASGMVLVPADRTGEGVAVDLLALENLTLPRLVPHHSRFLLRTGWQLREFERAVDRLRVKPANPYLHVRSFSGGNQQKILLWKWLQSSPAILVVHEPTQAVDVGARADILTELRAQADAGVAVVMVSIETQDLALVCDRILVMRHGTVVRELTGAELEPGVILDAVYPPVVPAHTIGDAHVAH